MLRVAHSVYFGKLSGDGSIKLSHNILLCFTYIYIFYFFCVLFSLGVFGLGFSSDCCEQKKKRKKN